MKELEPQILRQINEAVDNGANHIIDRLHRCGCHSCRLKATELMVDFLQGAEISEEDWQDYLEFYLDNDDN